MRNWPCFAGLTVCAVAVFAVLYWGGQDKQGQFRADILFRDLGVSLFFVGPYLVLATTALLSRSVPLLSPWVLVTTLILTGIGLGAVWNDHATYLQTPPGRETTPMGGFLATLVLWLGSATLLIATIIVRLILRVAKEGRDTPPECPPIKLT